MDITEYYKSAKELASLTEFSETIEAKAIVEALEYDEDNEHPSLWVPRVQKSLLEALFVFPKSSFSNQILALYNAGVIIEQAPTNALSFLIMFLVSLVFGISLGWIFWA
jgi:hypothetical protein